MSRLPHEPHRFLRTSGTLDRGCRRELLDRTLIWNLGHLRQILREYGIPPHRLSEVDAFDVCCGSDVWEAKHAE